MVGRGRLDRRRLFWIQRRRLWILNWDWSFIYVVWSFRVFSSIKVIRGVSVWVIGRYRINVRSFYFGSEFLCRRFVVNFNVFYADDTEVFFIIEQFYLDAGELGGVGRGDICLFGGRVWFSNRALAGTRFSGKRGGFARGFRSGSLGFWGRVYLFEGRVIFRFEVFFTAKGIFF